MKDLTNEDLDQIWAQADAMEDEKTLALVDEIDRLKASYAKLAKQKAQNKAIYKQTLSRTRKKSFHQGQAYMRGKVAHTLKESGQIVASDMALTTYLDYDIEPVGKYDGK